MNQFTNSCTRSDCVQRRVENYSLTKQLQTLVADKTQELAYLRARIKELESHNADMGRFLEGEIERVNRSHQKTTERMMDEFVRANEAEARAERYRKALAFYANGENFAVTVWEDESCDGKCWLEPATEHGLTEVYGENNTGEFGITAHEVLHG